MQHITILCFKLDCQTLCVGALCGDLCVGPWALCGPLCGWHGLGAITSAFRVAHGSGQKLMIVGFGALVRSAPLPKLLDCLTDCHCRMVTVDTSAKGLS